MVEMTVRINAILQIESVEPIAAFDLFYLCSGKIPS